MLPTFSRGHHRFDEKLELALTATGAMLALLGKILFCKYRKILASDPSAGEIPALSSRNEMVRFKSLLSVPSGTIDLM